MFKQFEINGYNYVFDGRTVELYKVYNKEELDNLLNKEIDTIYTIPNNKENNELMKLTLNISNTCNLNCEYCYAAGGNYKRQDSIMTKDTITKIVDEIKTLNYKKIKFVNIFGGEPLINFEGIKYAVKLINENFIVDKYSIVTNSTLLNEEIAVFFKENNFYITISLDGPEKIHDSLRGYGSYKKIIESINILKKYNLNSKIELACTYTPKHIEFGFTKKELREYFNSLGLKYNVSTVFSNKKEFQFNKPSNTNEIYENIDDSFNWIIQNKSTEFINPVVYDVLYSIIYKRKVYGFCDELSENFSLAYDYNGEKYCCFRFWGNHDYNINNKLNVGNYDKINNKKHFPKCKKCWARYLCRECSANILEKYIKHNIGIVNNNDCIKLDLYEYTLKKMAYFYEDETNIRKLVNNFNNFLK